MSFVMLDLANGPPCPRCGCRDVRVTQSPPLGKSWFMQGRATCRHCGTPFAFREFPQDAVAPAEEETHADDEFEPASMIDINEEPPRDSGYPVRECPHCGCPDTVIVSSGKRPKPGLPRIRYHRCRGCDKTFKSVDARHLTTHLRLASQ